MKISLLAVGLIALPSAHGLAADLASLEKRMDSLEIASYANTVTWNGFFENRFDWIKKTPEGGEEQEVRLHRWILGLDFKSKPAANLDFFGRVSASTMHNQGGAETTSRPESSLQGGRSYSDSIIRVERAFFNYSPMAGLSLSIGRLPTLDGPPTHLYDGLPRLGSYPKIIYAAVLDGYGLTYNHAISPGMDISFRFVNSPFMLVDAKVPIAGSVSYDKQSNPLDGVDHDLVDINGVMLDYSATGTSFARSINIIGQYLAWKDFKVLGAKWDYSRMAVYLEAEDIAKTGLNFYASLLKTVNKTEGAALAIDPITGNVVINPATGFPVTLGILSDKGDSEVKGQGTLLGLGYRVPAPSLKDPLLGFEMISSDKGYLIFDSTLREPFDFYGVRGKANQVYASFELTTGLKLRIGQVSANPEYAPDFLGEPKKSSPKNKSLYANFRLDF